MAKAALTLSNLNKHLGQLEVDFIDNVNMKEVRLAKKVLHLKKNGKNWFELSFLQKLSLMVFGHLNETWKKIQLK